MANTQAVCTSFKTEQLNGHHAFSTSVTRGSTAADTFAWVAPASTGTTAYSTPTASFSWIAYWQGHRLGDEVVRRDVSRYQLQGNQTLGTQGAING